MISKNGWIPFDTSIRKVGGMESLIEANISRNLWAIMKEFKVLPTNPDFQRLTRDQVEYIISNMNKDAEIFSMISKGLDPEKQVTDKDTSWWETPIEEFDPKGDLDVDMEDIARQVEELTSVEDRKRLAKMTEGNQEWVEYLEKEGNKNEQTSIEGHIQKQLEIAKKEAKMLRDSGINNWGKQTTTVEEKKRAEDFEPITQDSVEEAFKLFEGEDVIEDTGPDSDWI